MRTRVATKSAVVLLALAGTVVAFVIGAQAGSLLNSRVMASSVGRSPLPVVGSPNASPVSGYGR